MIYSKKHIIKTMSFWCICAVASLSVTAQELPDNTMAVMKINSLNEINQNWKDYLSAASTIDFKISLQDYIIDPFDLKSTNGIAMDQPIWGIYWRTENDTSSYGILYPVKNEEDFRQQLPNENQPDVVIGHNYALLTKAGEAAYLDTWFNQTDAMNPLKQKLHDSAKEVQLWIDFEKINTVYQEFLNQMIAEVPGDADEDQVKKDQGPSVLVEALLGLSQQVKTARLSADINQENITIYKEIEPQQDSAMDEFIQNYEPNDIMPMLAAYQPNNVFFGYLNANTQVAQTMLGQFWESLGDYKVEEMQDTADTAANGSMAYIIELSHEIEDPYLIRILQGTDSQEGARNLLSEILELTRNAKEKYQIGNDLVIKQDAGKVDNKDYSTIKYAWGLDSEETEQQNSPWGKDITLYASTFQNLMVMTNGDIEQFLNRMEKGTKQELQEEWPTEIGRNALAAARINLIEILRGVQMHLNKTSPGFNPLLVLKIPEVDTKGITMRADVEENQIQAQLLIPSKEINTLIRVITNEYPIDRESRNSKNRNQ